eukprot:m.93173 g.93173  ORF g.93173 m.93173 type:complete len:51 (+) comp14976_c0_seq3:833-985(+)
MVAFDCEWTPGGSSKPTVILLPGSIPIATSIMEREDVTVGSGFSVPCTVG